MKPLDTELAYRKCREVARKHYENFPVGSLLIPSDKRKYVYAVYAFARYADDIADSGSLSKDEKILRLGYLNEELDKIGSGRNGFDPETEYIFTALFDTSSSLEIPLQDFRDLLSAFRQDAVISRYFEFDELTDYSQRSANPVGRLVLRIFGYDSAMHRELFMKSDKICTALQLSNFWQDVSEDLKIDRIYIPGEYMNRHGYTVDDLRSGIADDRFRNMMRELCTVTEELFAEGGSLPEKLSGRLRYEIRATVEGGRMILGKIRELDYDVLNHRPKLKTADKLSLLYKAFRGN